MEKLGILPKATQRISERSWNLHTGLPDATKAYTLSYFLLYHLRSKAMLTLATFYTNSAFAYCSLL